MAIREIEWNEGEAIGLIGSRVGDCVSLARAIVDNCAQGTLDTGGLAVVLADELEEIELKLSEFYEKVPLVIKGD